MRCIVLCLFVLLTCFVGYSQSYRLVYDSLALPELYERVPLIVQQQSSGGYTNIPTRRFKLTTTDGHLDHNSFLYNRSHLYKNNGKAHFILHIDGNTIPLTVDLPVLRSIRYNLYTDSIKPVLNFYVNIEGVFTNGRLLPLDTSMVIITSNVGAMKGMEWVVPEKIGFDRVRFTAIAKHNTGLREEKTIYIKKFKDFRDTNGYNDEPSENEHAWPKGRR
jgi:hypothetical protein